MKDSWKDVAFFLFSNCSDLKGKKFSLSIDDSIISKLKEKQIDSLYYFQFDPLNRQQQFYEWVWGIQTQCLQKVLDALNKEGISYLIFKGAEFIGRYYDHKPINLVYDIDFLVPQKEIMKVQSIMHSLGYHYGSIDPGSFKYEYLDIHEAGKIMQYHYELPSLSKPITTSLPESFSEFCTENPTFSVWHDQYKTIVFAEFDFHYQLALDVVGDEVFDRKVASIYPGAYTLNPADSLWFTLSKYYNEVALHGKSSLRDFVYLIALLNNESIDWKIFLSSVREYKLHHSTYYFLFFCNLFLQKPVPEEIFSELDPLKNNRLKDWGWQIEKLFEEKIECPFTNLIK